MNVADEDVLEKPDNSGGISPTVARPELGVINTSEEFVVFSFFTSKCFSKMEFMLHMKFCSRLSSSFFVMGPSSSAIISEEEGRWFEIQKYV